MSRPHIEFVQAQHLTWEQFPARPGVTMKRLSWDQQSGALSAILRYPPGWRASEGTLAMDEEFFVLDGALDRGGTEYGADCYAFWPRFMPRRTMSAPSGATVLTFLSAPAAAPVPYDPARLTERIDVRQGEWKADLAAMGLEVMATTARIRRLRSDPDTNEITYITATIPYWQESQPERHPVIQEIFCLAGEIAGPQGIMRAGAYVWRPANITHGPYGSVTGAVFLFRSHGGPQSTEHDPPVPLRFDPPHRPVLPDELLSAGAPAAAATRY
jgi:Domain of unknown function (DUF4437)